MNGTKPIPASGHAPADQHPRPPRSRAAVVLAYVILAGLALVSIWYVDRAVVEQPPADEIQAAP